MITSEESSGHRVVLRIREIFDVAAASLLRLGQHQRRLLRYFGVDVE